MFSSMGVNMKYRTIIEVICEAQDKDDAYNIAGDYLRGHVEFVVLRCAARPPNSGNTK